MGGGLCDEPKCNERGYVLDDDTFKEWCWKHKKGVRHQECGCEYDLETFVVVVRCERHERFLEKIGALVKNKPKGKKVKRG